MTGRVLAVVAGIAALAIACSTADPAAPRAQQPKAITYSDTIAPILADRCVSCHRDGGIAPFSLETYEDVVAHSELAREKVVARDMPPWGAFDDDDCVHEHAFKDDLRMTPEEIQTFADWVDLGVPRGDASKPPPARIYAANDLTDKTNTFQIAKPFQVDAGGGDDFRCFSIDPGFTEDTWIGGANVVPGDPRVVHHVLVFVDPNSESPALAAANGNYPCFGGPETSNPSLLVAWAPGVPPAHYGDDAGIKVAKGSKLVMQIHYHPHPEITAQDQTSFELKVLPPGVPSFVSQILLIGNANSTKGLIHLIPPSGEKFFIPANTSGHVESMEVTIPAQVNGGTIPPLSLLAAGTHMHWAGTNMRVEVFRKNPTDGQPAHECLLGTPKYNFNWQRAYVYDEPMENLPLITPGDTLRFTCTYDNTVNNPNIVKALSEEHVSAPRDILLGETTLDEMCLGALVVVRRASVLDSF